MLLCPKSLVKASVKAVVSCTFVWEPYLSWPQVDVAVIQLRAPLQMKSSRNTFLMSKITLFWRQLDGS